MCDSVKNVPYVKNKCIHIMLQKILYYVLKGIMIMNNEWNIYILGLKNKYVRRKATKTMNIGFLKNNLVVNHTL